MILIDQVMPTYDRSELHRRQTTAAPPDLWGAIHDLRADELPLMRALMGVRALGRRADGANRTVLQGFERMGFRRVAEEPSRELVVAGIGQFRLMADLGWNPEDQRDRVALTCRLRDEAQGGPADAEADRSGPSGPAGW
jgi:hypothetical protein